MRAPEPGPARSGPGAELAGPAPPVRAAPRSRVGGRAVGVPEVAVAGALHDRLGAGELHAGAEALGHRLIGAAHQQEAELRHAEPLVELGVATASDVGVERVRGALDDLVVQGVARGELLEARGQLVPDGVAALGLPPAIAQPAVLGAQRLADDRVGAILAQ